MTEQNQKQLGNTLWAIADQLRGAEHNAFLEELGLRPLP